jgi:hypothetical protein
VSNSRKRQRRKNNKHRRAKHTGHDFVRLHIDPALEMLATGELVECGAPDAQGTETLACAFVLEHAERAGWGLGDIEPAELLAAIRRVRQTAQGVTLCPTRDLPERLNLTPDELRTNMAVLEAPGFVVPVIPGLVMLTLPPASAEYADA